MERVPGFSDRPTALYEVWREVVEWVGKEWLFGRRLQVCVAPENRRSGKQQVVGRTADSRIVQITLNTRVMLSNRGYLDDINTATVV